MSGQPCGLCHRWFTESYAAHNARHIKRNPHAFCQTMSCEQPGCPVDDWCELCQSYGNVHDPELHGIDDFNVEGQPEFNGAFR